MSDAVPHSLVQIVADRYLSTSVYVDKSAMLTDHPPTRLDCYELDPPHERTRKIIGLRATAIAALMVGSLPVGWIWQHDPRLIWAGALCFFVVATIVLHLMNVDQLSRSTTLLHVAGAIWLLAPLAGTAGTVFLQLPILQLAVLGLVQRSRLNRAARRFPARIARLEQ